MKFAFLIGGELRAIKKTIKNLYKYIIDFYDADVFILCQKQFDDDEENIKLFDRKLKFAKFYEKPDPFEYFSFNTEIIKNIENTNYNIHYKGIWFKEENLQIYINMNEYAKIIKNYINDYDYFIGLRSDIDIMFPFPEKELFEKIPNDVYGINPNHSKSWGGQGLPNFLHKNYILECLTSYYDYIKEEKNVKELFNIHDISDFCNYNNYPIKKFINQELLLLIALKEKNITMKNITNSNFYYTGNNLNDRTTSTELKYYNNTEKICKYNEQVNETLHSLKLWENNYRWDYYNSEIILKKNIYPQETLISILIPNYNKAEYIRDTLESIFSQTTFYKFKVIIIDDCSTDNSLEIIQEFVELYPEKITLYKNNKNIGTFQTSLKLYELITTNYFTVLDSDDYWIDNNFINNGLDFLENNNDYTIYANNTIIKNNNNKHAMFSNNFDIVTYDLSENDNFKFTHTSSTIFRSIAFNKQTLSKLNSKIGTPKERAYEGDTFRNIISLTYGKGCIFESLFAGVYRITEKGIWSSLTSYEKKIIHILFIVELYEFIDCNPIYSYFFLESKFIKSEINSLLNYTFNYTETYNTIKNFIEIKNKKKMINHEFIIIKNISLSESNDFFCKFIKSFEILLQNLNYKIVYIEEIFNEEIFNEELFNKELCFEDKLINYKLFENTINSIIDKLFENKLFENNINLILTSDLYNSIIIDNKNINCFFI
jgi:glycosyltransferase involved in cell wall biosynthesis